MKKKSIKPLSSIVLALVLLFANFNGIHFAHAAEELPTPLSGDVEEMREENVKVFQIEDNLYDAVSFEFPVHKKGLDGKWEDIPFGVSLTNLNAEKMYATYDNNTAVAYSFTPGKTLLSARNKDHAVKISLTSAGESRLRSGVRAEVENPLNTYMTSKEAMDAVFHSTVKFSKIADGIGLEYQIDPENIKESIIISKTQKSYNFTFEVVALGLVPELQDDGAIYFFSTDGEKEFFIPAPIMWDDKGAGSEDVTYELREKKEGVYSLTVIPNEEWITSSERQFPITIDPTLGTESHNDSTNQVHDTYIDGDTPYTGHGSSTMLWVRENRITYIRTPDYSIPEGAQLVNLDLQCFYFYFDYVHSGFVDVRAYSLDTNFTWNEFNLTYATAYSYSSDFGVDKMAGANRTMANIGATSTNPQSATFNLKDEDNCFVNIGNKGAALKYEPSSTNLSVVFKSSEASSTYRPRANYRYRTSIHPIVQLFGGSDSSSYNPDSNLNNFSEYESSVRDTLEPMGFNVFENGITTAQSFKSQLSNASIVIVSGHGAIEYDSAGNQIGTAIHLGHVVKTGDNPSPSEFWADESYIFQSAFNPGKPNAGYIGDSENYSNIKLIVFMGCETGAGEVNLPKKMVERGAKVAIGFKQTVPIPDTQTWLTGFIESLAGNHSISEAIGTDNSDTEIVRTPIIPPEDIDIEYGYGVNGDFTIYNLFGGHL